MKGLKEYGSEYGEFLFHTPSDLQKAIGIWPLHAGRMIAKPNYVSGPRFIHFYNVHFVLEGQVIYTYGGEQVILEKGDLFCLYPNVTFQYNVVPSNPNLQMAWIAFKGEGSDSLLQYVGLSRGHPYLRQALPDDFTDILQQMLLEFRRLHKGENYLHFNSIMYELFAQLSVPRLQDREPKQFAWIQQSIDFMNMHYAENITVQHVADYVGIHRSHFSTVFAEQRGISPIQYLQKLRMTSGAKMLKETVVPITEIAMSLGYPDLYSFTRAFRNYYGLSPSRFRKNSRHS